MSTFRFPFPFFASNDLVPQYFFRPCTLRPVLYAQSHLLLCPAAPPPTDVVNNSTPTTPRHPHVTLSFSLAALPLSTTLWLPTSLSVQPLYLSNTLVISHPLFLVHTHTHTHILPSSPQPTVVPANYLAFEPSLSHFLTRSFPHSISPTTRSICVSLIPFLLLSSIRAYHTSVC